MLTSVPRPTTWRLVCLLGVFGEAWPSLGAALEPYVGPTVLNPFSIIRTGHRIKARPDTARPHPAC